jgi:hypothetical protein
LGQGVRALLRTGRAAKWQMPGTTASRLVQYRARHGTTHSSLPHSAPARHQPRLWLLAHATEYDQIIAPYY